MASRRSLWAGLALGAVVASPAAAEAPKVVVSIKPVHSLVASVMEGVGAPVLIIEGAGSPHTYSLRPSEARAIEQADVVFWVGEGLETFLLKPLEALPTGARVVELAEAPGVTLLPTREGGMWEAHTNDHDDEHHDEEQTAHDEGHDHDREHHDEAEHATHEEAHDHDAGHHDEAEHAAHHDDDHGHGAFDLHIWLDPHNAIAMAAAIGAALSEVDPANAARYEQNAAALRAELERLDQALGEQLDPVRDGPFVVFHDAYQYFEQRYDLNAIGSISVGPERRPGAQRLGQIRDRLRATEAACVFAEPQFEPAVVDTAIEGTTARKGVLDPLGAALEAGPAMYGQLLENLAGALTECLGEERSG